MTSLRSRAVLRLCLALALSLAPTFAFAQDVGSAPVEDMPPPDDVPPETPPPDAVNMVPPEPEPEPELPAPPAVDPEPEPTVAPSDVPPSISPDQGEPLEEDPLPAQELVRPRFGENGEATPDDPSDDWHFGFHGYFRAALRSNDALSRPPYLVDDDYFLSGFNYTRVNEREWAELFLSAERDRTRLVVGLFASQFSDWSETTLQGQGGIATAFVEHTLQVTEDFELGGRVGMFWDRYGYQPMYDTYLIGRTHVAGLRLNARLFDMFYARAGIGAHADVISSNQGFTPVTWLNLGVDLGWLDAGLYAFHTWTNDSEREFAIIEDAKLTVLGGDVRTLIPHVGQAYLGLAHYRADRVLFLANGLELLHSTGGRGLSENFFGLDSENGTGEIIALAFDFTYSPWRTVAAFDEDAARSIRGLDLRLFSLAGWVRSKQRTDDPLTNRDDRIYLKWGAELFYRPPFETLDHFFAGVRFDRVILDTDHDSLSFRVITPRIGVTPTPGLDVFLAVSMYRYGDNITLRPNQVPGDVAARSPNETVLKLQAQMLF